MTLAVDPPLKCSNDDKQFYHNHNHILACNTCNITITHILFPVATTSPEGGVFLSYANQSRPRNAGGEPHPFRGKMVRV